jgi:hypothetical protein
MQGRFPFGSVTATTTCVPIIHPSVLHLADIVDCISSLETIECLTAYVPAEQGLGFFGQKQPGSCR